MRAPVVSIFFSLPILGATSAHAASALPTLLSRATPLIEPARFADDADAQEQYQYITGLAEKGMHDLVVREAKGFLKKYADHSKASQVRYRLASAHFERGEFDASLEHWRELRGQRSFEFAPEVAFRLGQCELERDGYEAAGEAFEAVLQTSSKYLHAAATFLRAECAFRSGEYGEADGWYARLEGRRAPEGSDVYAADATYGRSWCAFRQGEYDATVQRSQNFLQRWSDDERRGEMLFLQGEAHLEAERHGPAQAAYEQVPAGAFRDAALRGIGFARGASGDAAGAAASFRQLVEEYPESRFVGEAALQGGIQLIYAGQPEQAEALLGTQAAGGGAEVLYWRARAARELGRGEQALRYLERAADQEANEELRSRLGVLRGDVLFDLGRKEEAAQAYQASGSDYATHAAAVARLTEGDAAEAERIVRPLAEGQGTYRLPARLTLAEALFELERYDEAGPLFEELYEDGRDEAERARAGTRSAWCLLRSERFSQAAQRFTQVAERYPDSDLADEALFLAARAHEDAGSAQAAAASFQNYVRRHPGGDRAIEANLRLARYEEGPAGTERLQQLVQPAGDSEWASQVLYDLAERLSADGQHEQAAAYYQQLLTRHGDHELATNAAYGLAWSQFEGQDAAAALGTLETLLERNSGLDDELRLAALELGLFCARETQDGGRARAFARQVFERSSDDQRRLAAARLACETLRSAGELKRASQLYGQLLERTEDGAVAVAICVERAYLALDQGAPDQAQAELDAVRPYAPEDPDLAEAYFFLGEARYEAGQDEGARSAYAAAAKAIPEVRARALYKGGFVELRAEAFPAAAQLFQALAQEHPAHELAGEAWYLCGEAHYRAGDYERVLAPLTEVLQRHKRHATVPKALFRIGLAYAQVGRYEEARDHLARLARKHPDFEAKDEAELWRGRSLAKLGERRAAEGALRGVVQRDKGVLSARARIALGRLAHDAGELDDALSEYLKVAVLYAHEEEVGEALFQAGQVLESQQDPERAAAQYRELLERSPECAFAAAARERLNALND